jgi:hypothetical protein
MRVGRLAAMLAAVALGLGSTWGSSGAAAQDGVQPPECASAAGRSSDAALTIYPEVPLYAEQFGEARVPGPQLAFRTRLTRLPGPRKGDRVLVKVPDGTQCGYVQASKIHDGPPLKVSDIDPDEKVQAGLFGYVRNHWTIKAMLRSNPKLDTTAHEATLFDAPGGEGKPYKSTRVFSLFNIFKVDKRGSDPEDWWYFVGGKKVADSNVLSGWVRGGNLFLWGSGVAVYSSATNKGASFDVYTDIQMLQKGDKGGLLATRSGLEPPGSRDIAKFPVLDQIFKNAAVDRKAGTPPIAYEIGFFGEGCGRADDCDQSAKINDQLSKIGEIVRSAEQIDVMFVIDNTASMDRYFSPIARAVSRWAKETSGKLQTSGRKIGRIRFGASVYGDYRDRNRPSIADMDFRLVAQLDGDTFKLERALTGVGPTFADAIGDQPEAGYAALVRAAQETFWAADAGYRLLVWIGDQGVQREPGKLAFDPVDFTQVQRVLGEHKVFLTAINVAGSRPETSTFLDDAKRILDRSKMALGVPPVRTSEGSAIAREEPEFAAQRVTQLLDVVLFYSQKVPEWIQSQRGKTPEGAPPKQAETVSLTPKSSDLPLTKLVDVSDLKDGLFKRMGLTPEEVERVLNLKQLMTRGFVSYDDKQRNIAFFAAMEPSRFSLFHGSLTELCRAMSDDDDLRNRMLGLMLTLAHNLGGDPYSPSETIAEYFDRIIFIPKRHFASWLDQSATDFANVWGTATPEKKHQLKFSACRSAYLLQQMSLGNKVASTDDLDFDGALGKIQLKAGRESSLQPYSWLWSTESKIEYYFVPAEYLPKD